MDGQVHVGDGVSVRAGIAVGDILQRQFTGSLRLGDRLAILKPEGLRPLEEFPQSGKLQALLLQRGDLLENTGDPLGEAADGGEVEQELRGGEALPQRQGDQIGVGHAVAQQGQHQVCRRGPEVDPFPPGQEATIEPKGVVPDLVQPGPQAKDADVLGVGAAGDGFLQILHGF